MALLLVAAFCLLTLLIARMTAEIGIPWLVSFGGKAVYFPLPFLGTASLGPQALAVLATVGAVLDIATSNSIAAQQTSYGKLAESGLSPRRRRTFRVLLLVGLAVALLASVTATIWDNYSYGARHAPGAARLWAGKMGSASQDISRLQLEGIAEETAQATGLSKLARMKFDSTLWRFFFYGIIVIVGCTFLRLRFTWWPFHPLPFLFFNTWCMSRLYFSFLVGWLIKVALLRVGGGKVFSRSKPFFLGVITGQLVVGGFWIAVGVIYYLKTGKRPEVMRFFL